MPGSFGWHRSAPTSPSPTAPTAVSRPSGSTPRSATARWTRPSCSWSPASGVSSGAWPAPPVPRALTGGQAGPTTLPAPTTASETAGDVLLFLLRGFLHKRTGLLLYIRKHSWGFYFINYFSFVKISTFEIVNFFFFPLFHLCAALTVLSEEEGCFLRTIFVLYAVSIYYSK